MRWGPNALARHTFSSLKVKNYRLYFFGQTISLVGTWMQMTAQSWLVLTLTHSSTGLGFVVALQTLPVLLLGPYGGLLADRVNKRRLMIVLQSVMGLDALALGMLTVFGIIHFWEICTLAVFLGINNAIENPSRSAFIREMVGEDELPNAVALGAVMFNVARAGGPAVSGVLIATVGIGTCFLANAGSFIAVVASLLLMNRAALRPALPTARAKGQLREGFRYARHTPAVAIPLLMMGLVGMLAYEWQVSLPVFAHTTFHSSSAAYGFMTTAMGLGAIIGGLLAAARRPSGMRSMIIASTAFGIAVLCASAAPTLITAWIALFAVGWASTTFMAIGNSTVLLNADSNMQGRTMALWQVAFIGTTPIGGPLIGWIIATSNARIGLLVGGGSCLLAALGAALLSRRSPRELRERGAFSDNEFVGADGAIEGIAYPDLHPVMSSTRHEEHRMAEWDCPGPTDTLIMPLELRSPSAPLPSSPRTRPASGS